MNAEHDDREEVLTKRAAQERLLISKLSRVDLEDKYLKLYDENILLKKHCRKQEEKIKKMATKLLRLVNDRKRVTNALVNGSPSNVQVSKKIMRDVENEELIADLQQKLTESEMQNKRLRENLQTSKIQLQTLQSQKKGPTIYNGVNARIDTGLSKKTNKNIRTISTNLPRQAIYPQENYIVEELNVEKEELENAIESLENEIVQYKSEIDSLKYKLKEKELNYEEDLLNLKNRASLDHKQNLQENIDLIRLQREIKEKSNQYTELYQKFTNLSQQHLQLKDAHDGLLNEVERYHQQLKQEQQKTISLRTELKNLSQGNREIMELKERLEDLNRDNEILREANEKLLNNAFNLEREREFREKEKAYKIQIAQLEATLKSDVGEKGSILDKLSIERASYDKLNTEYRDMQVKYYEMKQQYDEMNEKLMFLNQEGNFDFKEVEEALIIVKERKSRRDNGFLNEFEDGKNRHYQRKIAELESHFAETARELEKTRHLLVTQVKINDDYKKEVQLIQAKMEEHKSEFDKKELETAQLLDIRAARIKKLERQLKDIAYGTKQVRVTGELGLLPNEHEDIAKLDQQQIAQLDRGQNIFEIHLTRLVLTDEALKILHEAEPSTFCTIEFYEHELQTSPIIKSAKPEYNFTSQYVIKVDEFFLHYLQKNTSTIELHQTVGSDYRTLAACQISFRDIIDRNIPRLNGTVRLISIDERNIGVTFGTLEYWASLIMPVDQAFRLYKERTKALGYISTNIRAMNEADKKFSQSTYNSEIKKPESVDNMNELNVNILRCTNIHSKEKARQPAAYCVYRFYDFKDHDTEIITASNYPEFNDHKAFAVQMDVDVDRYLRKESLSIYIFDDNQAENDPDYLGVVKIPLLPLAHNKDIKGTFEIARPDGRNNGSIDVNIYWQYIYLAPSASALNNKVNKKSNSSHKPTLSINNSSQILSKEKEYFKAEPDDKAHHEAHFNNQVAHSDQPKSQNVANKHAKKKSIDSIKSVTSNISVASRQSSQQKERAASPVQQKISSRRSSISSQISQQDSANMTIKNEENSPTTHHNDTYFADEHRTGSPNDWGSIQHEYRHLTNEALATTLESTTETQNFVQNNIKVSQSDNYEDDEDVVVTPKSSRNNTLSTFKKSDKVILEIIDFQIDYNCDALRNDEIKQIFASITFLDYEPAELETPSEPKPGPNKKVIVNFRKEFDVDRKNNFEARQKLATALQDPKKSIIIFSIVAEPEDEDVECEDICFGYINIRDIMQSNQDLKSHQITLKDSKNQNKSVGYMTINVEMLEALNAINEEIEPSETQ